MDETLNVVNATQSGTVDAQITPEATPAAEPAAGESASAEPAIQQQEKKAVQTPEENAKYAAARRKAEAEKAEAVQRAKDEAAAMLAKRFGISTPEREIKTLSDFEQYGIELELKQAGLAPETYKALRENDPEVKRAKEVLAQQEKANKDVQSLHKFREAFKEANGREFDISSDFQLYAEVKKEAEDAGKDLTDVFTKRHNAQLKAELAELKAKIKAQETNAANAASSPGSVQANGEATATGDYISPEEFEKNRGNRSWVVKNYEKLVKSRPKWGG